MPNAFPLDDLVEMKHPPIVPEIALLQGNLSVVEMWHKLDVEEPPYWLYPWVGGQSLARFTLDNAYIFKGATVLDFGPGTGLNSVAAAMCGAHVVAVDKFEQSLELTRENAALNVVGSRVETSPIIPPLNEIDVVLFGDMFYERPLSELGRSIGDKALSKGCRVLIGDPGREYLPRRRVRRLAKYTVPDTMMQERRISMPSYAFDYIPNT